VFQDGPEFQFREQIFIDEKPGSYEFADNTSRLTAAEVFANTPPAEFNGQLAREPAWQWIGGWQRSLY